MSVESVSNVYSYPSEPPRELKSISKNIGVDLAIMVTSIAVAALAGYTIALLTAGPIGATIAVAVTIGVLVGIVGCIAYHLLKNTVFNPSVNDTLKQVDSGDEEEVFSESFENTNSLQELSDSSEVNNNKKILKNTTYYTFKISHNETIDSLKERIFKISRISAQRKVPVDEMRLFYNTKVLESGRSLADYNIQEGSVNVCENIGCRGMWYRLEKINNSESNIEQGQIDSSHSESVENVIDTEDEKSKISCGHDSIGCVGSRDEKSSEDSSKESIDSSRKASDENVIETEDEKSKISSGHESIGCVGSRDEKSSEDLSKESIDSSSSISVENDLGTHIEDNSENLHFDISIRCFGEGSENFQVSENDTLESLKELIASRVNCSAKEVKLIFAGELLVGKGSLAEYNIQSGSTIFRK
ncbi:MAG: hypothetical protein H0T62_00590 [Parachlamydiaceae bacterium]|nr:hypothetical protein [Parachlamydiaceae bacterium]